MISNIYFRQPGKINRTNCSSMEKYQTLAQGVGISPMGQPLYQT